MQNVQRINTTNPIPLSKADANNFDNLILAMAGLVFWNTSNPTGPANWSINYRFVTEYVTLDRNNPEMELVVNASYAIGLEGWDFQAAFFELPEQHQQEIRTYLGRSYRGNRPNGEYYGWIKVLLLDPDNRDRIDELRRQQGMPPLRERQVQAALQRVEMEDSRPYKNTRLSRANRYTNDADGEGPAFFVEPPDLLHGDYRLQYLAWRQITYKLLRHCDVCVQQSQRPLTLAPLPPAPKRRFDI